MADGIIGPGMALCNETIMLAPLASLLFLVLAGACFILGRFTYKRKKKALYLASAAFATASAVLMASYILSPNHC